MGQRKIGDLQATLWEDRTTQEVISAYFNTKANKRRSQWFVENLKSYSFNSAFEIGLMGGRNIKFIKDAFNVRVGGIDVGDSSVKFARSVVPDGYFAKCSVYDLDVSDKYDLVFTMGVLIHIPPDGIVEALKKCIDKSSKYIMHLEGVSANNSIYKGPIELSPQKVTSKFQWRPNIVDFYKQLGYDAKSFKISNHKVFHCRDLTHLIVVEKC